MSVGNESRPRNPACVKPGGRLVVLDWCQLESIGESRSLHGAMMWKIQLDRLFRGAHLSDHAGFAHLFVAAGIGAPGVVVVPSSGRSWAR